LGIGLSLLISSTLLVWAFSLPFRRSSVTIGSAGNASSIQEDFSVKAKQRRSQAEEIREQAMVQHRDFLRLMKKQKHYKASQQRLGHQEAQQRWQRRTESMQTEIAKLTVAIEKSNASEDSMLWQDREHLIKVSEDSGN
jgi:hypothetical protein